MSSTKHPQPGQYQHYKGNLYEVLHVVKHSETEQELVLYKSVHSPQLWVRPLDMFMELVEINGNKVPRFKAL
ncbi:MAG: DUF1653 domain-containing protein [Cytophagaceae bacterium]|jgi:hypothetical protein|nr:DUF1653 domain-containing protein [Cytophagaceae bacterium]